jgi:hypothetical protein
VTELPERHPLNAAGDFYVVNGGCMGCTAPEGYAPQLIGHQGAGKDYHCYFKRQPVTEADFQAAIDALAVATCSSVRYGGTDERILRRLVQVRAAVCCDAEIPKDAEIDPNGPKGVPKLIIPPFRLPMPPAE